MNDCNHFNQPILHKGYEICEKIGSGGMSEVFKGKNCYLNKYNKQPLAIKLLKPEFSSCESALYSFETEYLITKQLAQENVITIHDFVISKDNVFLVMDYIDGVTLNKLPFVSGNQCIDDKIKLVLQIVKAIAFIHSNFVIHGDIKPSNIFIAQSGTVKIIDFGLSVSEGRVSSNTAYAASLKYSSPERLREGKVSFRDDVYSLGCVLYKILSGCHPFDNLTSLDAMRQGLAPRMIENIDLRLYKIIETMLSFDPNNRPENAKLVLFKIDHIL